MSRIKSLIFEITDSSLGISIIVVLAFGLLFGVIYKTDRFTGCASDRKRYPKKESIRQAKKDYPNCQNIKVLTHTPIKKSDTDKRSSAVLDVCGKHIRYKCGLYPPVVFNDNAPNTYDCKEAPLQLGVILDKMLEDYRRKQNLPDL